jgi:general secretion pathway protein D
MNLKSRTLLLLTLAGLWSATSWVHAQPADAQPIPLPGGGTSDASGQANTASITLAFQNTDIEPVSAAVAKATGQSIIVDPRVKGKVSLMTPRPVTKQGALDLFSSALRSAGFALVQVNGIYRVVPEADAKIQGNTVLTQNNPDGDQVVTRVFKIKQDSATNLVNVLKPLLTPNSSITANPGNNTIIVTDYASNVKRVAKLIDSMDEPTVGDVQTVHLRYGVAIDVASILNKVVETSSNPADAAGGKTVVIAEPRSNSILIKSSNPEKIRQIRSLITRIDTPTANSGNIWVVPLKNAEASKLAVTLRAIVAADNTFSQQSGVSNTGAVSGSTGNTPQPPNQPNMPQAAGAPGQSGSNSMSAAATSSLTSTSAPTTGGLIQADPPTNSLIITASEPYYRHLRQVIDQLDKRRTQIYVEAMIAEVASNSSAQLGIQWQGIINAGGQNVPFGGTNYGAGNQNIFDLSKFSACLLNPAACVGTTSAVTPANGLNVGMLSKFGGNYSMSALIQALDTEKGFRVLSTPNLVTLDNEEARIMVGQNVPILSGSYTTNATSQTTPFQTYNRQDIGVLLRVRPQVAQNGTVKLSVYQEVSQLETQNPLIVLQQGYTILKRNIESNIIVDDGQLFVIGGLIDDQYNDMSDGVPFLKDIPLIGQLFRYDSKNRNKRNLMVFLRPYIIKDAKAGEELTANRFDFIQDKQDEFKQLPMLLPKENLPTMESFSKPLTHPGAVPHAPTLTP